MPTVLPLGVSIDDFWDLNVHKVNILVKAFNEKTKNEIRQKNMLMHLQGMYFADALLSTVGNMFRGKGQKAFEYPQEPYTLDLDYEEGLDIKNDSEKEIALQRRQFVNNLNSLFGNISRTLEENDADY